MKKFLAIFILIFALLGLCLTSFHLNFRGDCLPAKKLGHLKEIVPATAGDFTSQDIPLGATEEVAGSIEKTLSVNEYLNRAYTDNKGNEFTLYISYWAQGKESTARAAAHTPDRCWVSGGWKNIDSKRLSAEVLSIDGKELMPAYYREMTYDSSGMQVKRNIWFWFTKNGERYDYGTEDNMMPSISKYMENVIYDAFVNSPECYFVRIDSSNDLRELLKDEGFQEILDSLGRLILYKKGN